jgi:hypothetical protein
MSEHASSVFTITPTVGAFHALKGNNDLPCSTVIAVFVEVNALPSAHCETTVLDWNRQSGAHKGTLYMRWHIIRT